MLTKQEMFDRAYRGLSKQKWKQSKRGDSCVYNGPNGTHCAYGWIDRKIPAKFNSDCSINTLYQEKIGVAATLDSEMILFACELQAAHDDGEGPREMRAGFVSLAKEHHLKLPRLSP